MRTMVRRARTVLPGYVHHVMQSSHDGQPLFSSDRDYEAYLDLLGVFSARHGFSVWAYCLVQDHVRLIGVPGREDALRDTIRDVHAVYATHLNRDKKHAGPVWKDRFSSCILDDLLVLSAVRLVEAFPLRRGLTRRAESYRWSSAAAHCGMKDSPVLSSAFPPPGAIEDWAAWLAGAEKDAALESRMLLHTRTGHPCGTHAFVSELERQTGRVLRPQKRGPKPRKADQQES